MGLSGTEWVRSLPSCEPGGKPREQYAAELAERERLVLKAVRDGFALVNWSQLVIREGGHEVALLVMGDALRIGEGEDQVRPSCTQPTLQRIADTLDALLPTEKICDVAWQQAALRLVPTTQAPDSRMATTARMLEHSRAVTAKIKAAGFTEGGALFGSTCKRWCLTNKLEGHIGYSANFGWHVDPMRRDMPGSRFRSNGGLPVLQPLATAHQAFDGHGREVEANHNDYSQGIADLVSSDCYLDGHPYRVADLYRHPTLHTLVSYEGPLRILRHPAVTKQGADPYPDTVGLGSRGELVATWQRWMNAHGAAVAVDGSFGPKTEAATKAIQRERGLEQTGRLDAATQALMGEAPAELHAPSGEGPFADDVNVYPHVINCVSSRRLAKFYTPARTARRDIRGVCIHTAESLEVGTGAEAVAAFFADPKKPRNLREKPYVWVPSKVSAHFCVDNNSTVQCVPVRDVAYAAPGANKDFVHIELSGYARQTVEEWDDDYSRAELAQAAKLVAALAKDVGFPAVFVDVDGLLTGQAGITTHAAVSKAWHQSDHTDPGPNFPMMRFLELVQYELALLG